MRKYVKVTSMKDLKEGLAGNSLMVRTNGGFVKFNSPGLEFDDLDTTIGYFTLEDYSGVRVSIEFNRVKGELSHIPDEAGKYVLFEDYQKLLDEGEYARSKS